MLNEWFPTTLGALTAPFFALGLLAVWLAGRRRDAFTRFEQLALLVTFASGLLAGRSVVWFALTALVLLPAALDLVLRPSESGDGSLRLNATLAAVSLAVLALLLGSTLLRPAAWFEQQYPPTAADAVADAADALGPTSLRRREVRQLVALATPGTPWARRL